MPAGLVVRVLRRLLRPLVQAGTVTFFVRELGEAEPGPPELPGIAIRTLRPGEIDALAHGSDPARSRQALTARFDAGDLCFAALDDRGRALHTRWVTLGRAYVPELHRDFEPGSEAAYAYDAYTRPDARRRGLDSAVRRAVFSGMRALGRVRVYSYARGDNPEGLRAAARHQRPLVTLRYVRLLGGRPSLREVSGALPAGLLREPASGGAA
jgi:GNAT superfamily N-acetyltransferase